MDNNRLRRASKLGNDYIKYTFNEVINLYGEICYLCNEKIDMLAPRKAGIPGWEKGLHIDHVIDIAAGGPDTLDNVRPTHGICNLKKPKAKRKI
jgi:5-methylcytosine-specific restriction endonuclease McrA